MSVKPKYVSAATQSVTIALQSGTKLGTFDVSAASSLCTKNSDGSRKCVAGVQAPSGNDTFSVTAYDQPNGTGNALATGTLTQSISASTPSTISVSLTGITASIKLALQNTLPAVGTAASIPVIVQALDASGNTILGTYDRTITLTDSDTSGHTSLATTSVTASGTAVTLQYDGTNLGSQVSISASAPGIASAPAVTMQSEPAIAAEYDMPMIWSQDGSYQIGLGASGIVQGSDGNFWIAAATAGAILKMTPSGQTTTYWTPTAGSFPQEEVVGKDGAIWFTERDGNNIGRITTAGTFTEYAVPTQFSNPTGITIGPDGNIWFTEELGCAVAKMAPDGTITEYPLGAQTFPTDLTVGPDGNLWVAEGGWAQKASAIVAMTTSGTIVKTYPLASMANGAAANPYGIITGPDGNLWFGEYNGTTLDRLTTGGQITRYTTPSSMPGIAALAISKNGDIWFAENGSYMLSAGQVGYITPGQSTIHEVYLNVPLHVRGIVFDKNGALWYSGFFSDDSNVGEIMP